MPFLKTMRLPALFPLAFSSVACLHQAAPAKENTVLAAKSETAPAPVNIPKELPQRQELPLVLRETLSTSMNRHGAELTFLLANVVLLEYDDAAELAQVLADEPTLGRPVPGDQDSLNALLPAAFFVHQDQLRQRAKALALAARARDDSAFVKAFGAIAETCVGCHSSYLHDPLHAEPDHDEPYGLD